MFRLHFFLRRLDDSSLDLHAFNCAFTELQLAFGALLDGLQLRFLLSLGGSRQRIEGWLLVSFVFFRFLLTIVLLKLP